MSSREVILEKVKKGYKMPVESTPTSDPVTHIIDDKSGNLVDEYINRATNNRAIVVKTTQDKIFEEIQKILEKEKVTNLIYPDKLPIKVEDLKIQNKTKFEKDIEDFKDKIFDYDVSIIEARNAVSSHGIVAVASSKTQPRSLSLTPKVCICLVKKESIVKSMSESLNKIFKEDGRLPTNLIYISGPSRTADIELITIIGVHGSQIFYSIVY